MSNEYGIDGHVEIFEGTNATGRLFNVQLKSSEKDSYDKVPIKTTTRNYWKRLDMPTLVVLVDAGGTVHYGWAHLFDIWGRKENADTYTFTLPNVWSDNSAAEIDREIRAAHAARNLRVNLPIYWSVADDGIDSSWAGRYRVAVERALSSHRELTRREDRAGPARLEIALGPRAISVRLNGTPGGFLHYDTPIDGGDPEATAADVTLGLAMEIQRGGLDVLALALVEQSISASSILVSNPEIFAFALARVSEAGRGDSALALIERVYLDESIPFREIALPVLIANAARLDGKAISAIAERIATHAATADDGPAGTFYYNAGRLIRRFDDKRAIVLHNLAADRFPEYRNREYWWRELGQMVFMSGDLAGGAAAYQNAVDRGDEESVPLLADALALSGEYGEAIRVWNDMAPTSRFIWRLKVQGLEGVTAELSITSQKRDIQGARTAVSRREPSLEALRLDLLNFAALWQAGLERRGAGVAGFKYFYLTAAAFAGNDPTLWYEALLAVHDDTPDPKEQRELELWVVMTAVQEDRAAFREFVLTDDQVSKENRKRLLELIDKAQPPEPKSVIRGDGKVMDFPAF